MGSKNIQQEYMREPNVELGPNKVFPAPKDILPRVSARKWGSGPLMWKIVALMMGLCLIAVVVLGMLLLLRDSNCPVSATSNFSQSSISQNGIPDGLPNKLRFIERAEWGAQSPTEPLTKLQLPVPYVIISSTSTELCTTQSECTFRVRFAQTFHMESRGWADIAYNFLIGGMGYAYVGRGWDFVGAHAYNWNTRSIGISFIGTFNAVVPTKEQLVAAQELIEFGVKAGKISPDYVLLGHRQVSSTLSPGDALFSVIQTWPHWANISYV